MGNRHFDMAAARSHDDFSTPTALITVGMTAPGGTEAADTVSSSIHAHTYDPKPRAQTCTNPSKRNNRLVFRRLVLSKSAQNKNNVVHTNDFLCKPSILCKFCAALCGFCASRVTFVQVRNTCIYGLSREFVQRCAGLCSDSSRTHALWKV